MVKKSKSTQQVKKLNDADQQKKVDKTIQKKTENSKYTQDEQLQKCQQNENKKPEMIQTTLEQFWKKGKNINIKQRQKYEAPPLIFEQGCITPNAEWWRINFCLETKTTN